LAGLVSDWECGSREGGCEVGENESVVESDFRYVICEIFAPDFYHVAFGWSSIFTEELRVSMHLSLAEITHVYVKYM
jgi:hypothetical protein